jgi:hypothetical protein
MRWVRLSYVNPVKSQFLKKKSMLKNRKYKTHNKKANKKMNKTKTKIIRTKW